MKNLLLIFTIIISFIACEKNDDTPANNNIADTVTLSMGAGYANDIYYNMDSGVIASVSRTNWDIAFHTNAFSSTILTNGGSGALLYQLTADTSMWSSVDTTGIKGWTPIYNSDTTWTFGAFERNATVHPDYGWGEYNSTSHDVIGNKLFVIKLVTSNVYKKIWIKKKLSTLNKFVIQYSNLDNSGNQLVTVDCSPYTSKNFIYFSLTSNSVIDREPESSMWDFVATKYIGMVPTPYIVTGILTNTMRISSMGNITYTGVTVAQRDNVAPTLNNYDGLSFSTSISTIGSDWKIFNMATNKYELSNDTSYFIKKNSSIFKIYFTKFAGSSTGSFEFIKLKVK